MRELDVPLPDGRTLHAYDAGDDVPGAAVAVLWHHGTPNTGPPPAPLLPAAQRLGVRWVGYDRPGYGGSTPNPGRDVGSAAADAVAVADALGLDRFAVMGHSGGGPHALACAARLPDRVTGAVCGAGLAPADAELLDYFAGMADSGVAALTAGAAGREARLRHEQEHGESYDPEFTHGDLETLRGPWSWLLEVVNAGIASGPEPAADDDVAYATPWGFDPAEVLAPVLLLHGDADRVAPLGHARWLSDRMPDAELRVVRGAGHLSVLEHAEDALEWLVARA